MSHVYPRRRELLPTSPALGASFEMAPSAEDMEWRNQGACRNYDPTWWTPDPPQVEEKSQQAIKICKRECPVMEQCKQWALEKDESFGVWGGLSEGQREAIKRKRLRARKRRYHASVVAFYAG